MIFFFGWGLFLKKNQNKGKSRELPKGRSPSDRFAEEIPPRRPNRYDGEFSYRSRPQPSGRKRKEDDDPFLTAAAIATMSNNDGDDRCGGGSSGTHSGGSGSYDSGSSGGSGGGDSGGGD